MEARRLEEMRRFKGTGEEEEGRGEERESKRKGKIRGKNKRKEKKGGRKRGEGKKEWNCADGFSLAAPAYFPSGARNREKGRRREKKDPRRNATTKTHLQQAIARVSKLRNLGSRIAAELVLLPSSLGEKRKGE